MRTVILTEEQLAFLQTLVSHDSDLLEPMVRNADLSFDTSEDDFDVVALRDLMSTTVNALIGKQETPTVHAFHGTRETCSGGFMIDCDRSLDEGPNVLTCSGEDPTFMGWAFGAPTAKFVETPQYLAGRVAALIEWALSNESACEYVGIDMNDVGDLEEFVAALGRVAVSFDEVPQEDLCHDGLTVWEIVGPYGVEWCGPATDELAALDAWASSMEMETYSEVIVRTVREGDGPSAFRIDGVMNATHSNYNVVVREHLTRDVIVHLKATVVDHVDDDNTVQQRLLEAIDAIRADGVESIDVTLVEDAPDVGP